MHRQLLTLLLPLALGAPATSPDKSNATIVAEWLQDLATLPFDHTAFGPAPEDHLPVIFTDAGAGICDFLKGIPDGNQWLSWDRFPMHIPQPEMTGQMQVLNFPTYANWTEDDTWNIRLRAFVHEAPELAEETLKHMMWRWEYGLAPKLKLQKGDLSPEELDHYANFTHSFLLHGEKWKGQSVTVELTSGMEFDMSTENTSLVLKPFPQEYPDVATANEDGDIESPLIVDEIAMRRLNAFAGDGTKFVQRLDMDIPGALNGNSTAYLVPEEGITILSDIDDTLRVAKPFMNMPEIFANWAVTIPDLHFHYLSSVPEQFGRQYLDWMLNTYPHGSFDMRPNEPGRKFRGGSVRNYFMNQIFEYFPQRQFVLIGDITNPSTLSAYPAFFDNHPNQVLCILIRNVTATDSEDQIGYDTSGFAGIPEDRYMFFSHPDDLLGLDIADGKCRNQTLEQSVDFGDQDGDMPASHDEGAGTTLSPTMSALMSLSVSMAVSVLM